MGLVKSDDFIEKFAKTNFPEYTTEEKAKLRRTYSPAQVAALEAGEAAIDPEDLARGGRIRVDPHRMSYIDDFSTIQPVIDKRPRTKPPPDPNARFSNDLSSFDFLATWTDSNNPEMSLSNFAPFMFQDVPIDEWPIEVRQEAELKYSKWKMDWKKKQGQAQRLEADMGSRDEVRHIRTLVRIDQGLKKDLGGHRHTSGQGQEWPKLIRHNMATLRAEFRSKMDELLKDQCLSMELLENAPRGEEGKPSLRMTVNMMELVRQTLSKQRDLQGRMKQPVKGLECEEDQKAEGRMKQEKDWDEVMGKEPEVADWDDLLKKPEFSGFLDKHNISLDELRKFSMAEAKSMFLAGQLGETLPGPEDVFDADSRDRKLQDLLQSPGLNYKFWNESSIMTDGTEKGSQSALAPALPNKVPGVAGYYAKAVDPEDNGEDPQGVFQDLKKQTGLTLADIKAMTTKILVHRFVSNQTRLGKIRSSSVMVVAGNQNGWMGLGMAKSTEPSTAVAKAKMLAIRNLRPVPRYENRTIYGNVEAKVGATIVQLYTRPPGE